MRGYVTVLVFGLFMFSAAVHAEEATATAEAAQQLDEVLVTAQKRTERLQDIPQSVRAIGATELQRMGADSLETYTGAVPGIQLNGDRNFAEITMRGVTTGLVNQDQAEIKETVGLYLDEAPIAVQRFSPNLKLFDLERIEVLRGPQGTLYGAGSMSGAIRMITRKPDPNHFEAQLAASGSSLQHGGGSGTADGMVNIPLAHDTLGLRVVAFYRNNAGFLRNTALSRDDVNDETAKGGRAMLRWTPNERLTIDALHFVQEAKFSDASAYSESAGFLNNDNLHLEPSNDRTSITTLTMSYQFDAFDVTSATSRLSKNMYYALEGSRFAWLLTGVDLRLQGVANDYADQRDFSEELRVSSHSDAGVRWTFGAFFQRHQNHFAQDITIPGVDAIAGFDSTAFGTKVDQLYASNINIHEKQYALFGEIVVPFVEKFALTLGGRWFKAKQDSSIDFRGLFAFPLIGVFRFDNEVSGFNPRAIISYKIDEQRMVYAQAAKGFRLGGTNEPVPSLCDPDLAAAGFSSAPQSYRPDHLWNYEVGAKTEWLDRRLTLNGALYRIDWKDPQVTSQLGCGFNVYVNAGKMSINGFEGEATVRPTESLTFGLHLGYIDSTLGSDLVNVGGRDGDAAPYTPKWTGGASANYTWPIGANLKAFVFGNYQYMGSRYTRFDRSAANAYELHSYGLLNLRIGVQTDRWSVEIFGENVGNIDGDVDRKFRAFVLNPAVYRTITDPRRVGLRASLHF